MIYKMFKINHFIKQIINKLFWDLEMTIVMKYTWCDTEINHQTSKKTAVYILYIDVWLVEIAHAENEDMFDKQDVYLNFRKKPPKG